MPRIAALLLLVPIACNCNRPDPGAQAQSQVLQSAAELLQSAPADADHAAMRQELAELRTSVDATNAKLDALAAEMRQAPPLAEAPLSSTLGAAAPPTNEAAAAIAAAVRCASPERCTIDRAFVETLIINPGSLARQARVVPSVKDGVMKGFKLYGLRMGSLPKALGLKNGDLVHSINGNPLTSMEEALALYAKLRHESTFTVVIERRDGPFTLTIDVVGGT